MSTPKTCLVIDLEATCWESQPPSDTPEILRRNEIIEIGITTICMEDKVVIHSESILVWPTSTEISKFCTDLTTLTPEFVTEHGIPFQDAIKYMKDKYKTKRNMWASWGDWDMLAFRKQCENEKVPYPFNQNHLNIKALFCWKYGFNCGVSKALGHMGKTFEGTAHRGIDDSKMIADIFLDL